ncbi:MAG: Sir2 family NAD+-dependent deacetylase [Alphaproteobacteria bacterium]
MFTQLYNASDCFYHYYKRCLCRAKNLRRHNRMKKIVILTGAGISAESGLSTFRDNNGLWENHRIEDVATPEAFSRNPELVYHFYNLRRKQLHEENIVPNKAHLALVHLEEVYGDNLVIITQNVDNLHETAGNQNIYHMHGELNKARCNHCEHVSEWTASLDASSICPNCQLKGYMRPHIVWFGEMPFYMDFIEEKLRNCNIFASIGTSGNVYPAAGFVELAHYYNPKGHTIELNLEPSLTASLFKETRHGKASDIVPLWVDEMLP